MPGKWFLWLRYIFRTKQSLEKFSRMMNPAWPVGVREGKAAFATWISPLANYWKVFKLTL